MSSTTIRSEFCALLLFVSAGAAQATQTAGSVGAGTLVEERLAHVFAATTTSADSGQVVRAKGGPPWSVDVVGATAGGTLIRRFGSDLWLVNSPAGTVERVALNGGASELFDLGVGSAPQDVQVVAMPTGDVAWIVRRDDTRLVRIDLATGAIADSVDLSALAPGASLEQGTLERDGNRLFVQLEIQTPVPGGDGGVGALAVVDHVAETLVDVDPNQAGMQPILLQGAPPRLKMQVVPQTRTLFVSANKGALDGKGAIEMVDLDGLVSIGFAVSEQQVADLSGFVMTSPGAGYLLFHTDFAASVHVLPFSLAGGPGPGPETLVLLGDQIGQLTYDSREKLLFLPSRFANGERGIWVIDTVTNEVLGSGPIPTSDVVHDVIVAR